MSVVIESRFGLAEGLRVGKGDVVSLVGAGGKTTILYGLVAELRRLGLSVVATTTTNLQSPDSPSTTPPLVFASEEGDWIETVRARVKRYGSATVVGTRVREDKLKGLEPQEVDLLRCLADCLVIEADGARGRSLKAPASHEPVIPESTTLTVAIAALDALEQPLDEQFVHRIEVVSELAGVKPGSPITEEVMTLTLLRGYQKTAPGSSRLLFFLNKADDSRLKRAERVGRLLLAAGAKEVVFGEAQNAHGCFYAMTPSPAG